MKPRILNAVFMVCVVCSSIVVGLLQKEPVVDTCSLWKGEFSPTSDVSVWKRVAVLAHRNETVRKEVMAYTKAGALSKYLEESRRHKLVQQYPFLRCHRHPECFLEGVGCKRSRSPIHTDKNTLRL